MTKILIVAETEKQTLKHIRNTITAAIALQGDIDILISGYQCEALIKAATQLPHIKKILVADNKVYEHQLAENMAKLVSEVGKDYNYILANSSTFGKNLLPRVAALLDTSMISEVIKVISGDTFVRPIYAGNALATVKTTAPLKILTIRTTTFPSIKDNAATEVTVENIDEVIENDLSRFEKASLTESKRPDLTSARIVISGGRGLKSAENFHLIENIADRLGAAVGASRAAVDAGFAPNDYQVGQTGKVVAPDLYIAVGISGAIQHLAGIKDSKVIVAINNDPDAPIFQIADYGLVGDLFKILPELNDALDKVAS